MHKHASGLEVSLIVTRMARGGMNGADMHCYAWPSCGTIWLVRAMDGLYDALGNVQMQLSVPSSGQKAGQEPQPAARAASLMPLPWLAPGAGSLQHVPPSPPQPLRQPAITRPPPRPLNGAPCHEEALFARQWISHVALRKPRGPPPVVPVMVSGCVYKDCLEACCGRGGSDSLQLLADALGGRRDSQPASAPQQPDQVPILPVEQSLFAEALTASWDVHSSSSLPASPLKPAHSSGTGSTTSGPTARPASAALASAAPARTASARAAPAPQLQHLSEDGNADIMAFLLHGVQRGAQQSSRAATVNYPAAQHAPRPASPLQPEPPAASMPSSAGELSFPYMPGDSQGSAAAFLHLALIPLCTRPLVKNLAAENRFTDMFPAQREQKLEYQQGDFLCGSAKRDVLQSKRRRACGESPCRGL